MQMRNFIDTVARPSGSNELLLEVVLFAPVANVLAPHITEIEEEQVRKWFLTNFGNWLIKQPENLHQLTYLPPGSDPKQAKAFSFKDLWEVRLTTPTITLIDHLVDFFRAHPNLPRLERMSVPDAEKAAELWVKQMNAKAQREPDDPGQVHTLMTFANGYTIVDLTGQNALGKEGQRMGHCVGGYCPYVTSGKTRIFSLRDPHNMPHATIELSNNDNSVRQIKGRQNRAPVRKYWPMIRTFLDSIQAKIQDDYQNVGLLQIRDPDTHEYLTVTQDQFRDIILDPNNPQGQKFLADYEEGNFYDRDLTLGLFTALYGSPRLTAKLVREAFRAHPSLAMQHVAAQGNKFTPEQLVAAFNAIHRDDVETMKELLRVTKPEQPVIKSVLNEQESRGDNPFMLALAVEMPEAYRAVLAENPDLLARELAQYGTRAGAPFFAFAGTDQLTDEMIGPAFTNSGAEALKRIRRLGLTLSDDQVTAALRSSAEQARYSHNDDELKVLEGVVEYTKPRAHVLSDVFKNGEMSSNAAAQLLPIVRKHVPDQIDKEVVESALIGIDQERSLKQYVLSEPNPGTDLQKFIFENHLSIMQSVQQIDPAVWPLLFQQLRPASVEKTTSQTKTRRNKKHEIIYKLDKKTGDKVPITYKEVTEKDPKDYAKEVNRARVAAQRTFLSSLDVLLREPSQVSGDLLDPKNPKMTVGAQIFASKKKSALFNLAVKHLNRSAEVTAVSAGDTHLDIERFAQVAKTMRPQELMQIFRRGYYSNNTRFMAFLSYAPERAGEVLEYAYSPAGQKSSYHSKGDLWGDFKGTLDKEAAFTALASVWDSKVPDGPKDRFATAVLKRFKPSPGNLIGILDKADNADVTTKILKKTKKPSPELLAWTAEAFPSSIVDAVPLAAIPDKSLAAIFKNSPKLAAALMRRDLRAYGTDSRRRWASAHVRSRLNRNSDEYQRYEAAAQAGGASAMFDKWAHQTDLDDNHEAHDDATIKQHLHDYSTSTLVKLAGHKPEVIPMYFDNFSVEKLAGLVRNGLIQTRNSYTDHGRYVPRTTSVKGADPAKISGILDRLAGEEKRRDHVSKFAQSVIDSGIKLDDDLIGKLLPLVKDNFSGSGHKNKLLMQIKSDKVKDELVSNDPYLLDDFPVPTPFMVELLFDKFVDGDDERVKRNDMPYWFKNALTAWFRESSYGPYKPNPVAAKLIKSEAIKRGGKSLKAAAAGFRWMVKLRNAKNTDIVH